MNHLQNKRKKLSKTQFSNGSMRRNRQFDRWRITYKTKERSYGKLNLVMALKKIILINLVNTTKKKKQKTPMSFGPKTKRHHLVSNLMF